MRKSFIVLLILCLSTSIFAACDTINLPTPIEPIPIVPTYTISFSTDTTDVVVSSITKPAGEQVAEPSEPLRNGYKFDGWLLDGEPYTFSVMPEQNITLTALWKKLTTITFNTGSGASNIAPLTNIEQADVAAPAPPTRPHFKFNGWLLNGEPYTFSVMPSTNITIDAAWIEAITINFISGVSGIVLPPMLEPAGTIITAPPAPTRAGYSLTGWTLNSSRYNFTKMPTADITLKAVWAQASNLPSLIIDLTDNNGNTINLASVTREQYVKSIVSVQNTSKDFIINSAQSEFKGRGNGSWNEAKKGYRIKFASKQSMLGNPKSKHWVILACTNSPSDASMSKNSMAFNMTREVFTDIEYTTSAQWVDTYVNGTYQGVYLLCEQVRVEKDRVDIKSEYGVLDTGYLVEYDAYAYSEGVEGINYFTVPGLKYPFTVKSPDPDGYRDAGITYSQYKEQVRFIKNYVTRVMNAALAKNFTTFSELADVNSFVDMYILHELFKNTDTGYSSFYMYKKPGGKLYAGPAWDFDLTAGASRNDPSPTGIYVSNPNSESLISNTYSELYISLMKNASFKKAVVTRWKVVSPNIAKFVNQKLSDDFIKENKFALGRNFVKWNNLSQSSGETHWANATIGLRDWLTTRTNWLNTEWK